MKTSIVCILIAAAFLGGYYLGRHPGSPDILAWAQQTCQQVTQQSQHTPATIEDKAAETVKAAIPDKVIINIGGKSYVLGGGVEPQK